MPDETRLLNAIDRFEENAYGSDHNGDLANERSLSIDRYLGKNIAPAPEGRSQVRDRSVYETVQWMMPSLARIFASGDAIVELPPIGPEDEEPSKQEAEYLNFLILQKNNWHEIFDTSAKDALLTKAGYLHPYVEKRRQVEVEKYERQTPESLALLMEEQPEILSQKEYPDPDYKPQPMMAQGPNGPQPVIDIETGQPAMQPPPMLYDIEIRRVKEERVYCIDALPPERCKIAETTKTVQVATGCDYFEFYDFPTISDLRQMGLDVEDDIASEDEDTLEDNARDQYGELESEHDSPNDPSMRRVKCRWVWVRHDYDEDGIAELQYCIVVGKEILHREECNRIPIAVLCPDKLPHRHIGLCPADTVSDIEDIRTAILRQGLDNLYINNNLQKFGDPSKVNLDDFMVSRPGGITRTRNGAVFMQDFGTFPVANVFPQAMEALEYMSHVRENRTGVNNSFQGLDANQLSQLQPGTVNQISSMAAQRVEQIARHIANGIEVLASLMHELVLKSGHKYEVVKLRGQWVEVDPSTWRERKDFRISVGYSAGNKDSQIARLQMIGNMQKEALMGGLSICNERNVYETALELTKATDMQAPQRFWTDPAMAPPKQPPQPDPTVMAMEQLKAQSAQQVKQLDVEQKERDSQRDFELGKYQTDVDAQVKLSLANAQAEQSSMLERQKGEQGVQIEQVRASLNPKTKEADAKASEVKQKDMLIQQFMESQRQQTEAIGAMFDQMLQSMKAMNGPKRIVRDKNGRAEGVEPVMQ